MRIPTTVLTSVFILSLVAFVFALVLHTLTYVGVDARDFMPATWYSFQIATALLIIPIMISGLRERGPTPRQFAAPAFLRVCCGVFLLYAFFNWPFTLEVLNHGKTPEILNGHYVMMAHGIASPVTESEYLKHRVFEARANSGHWMALWSWAAIWCFDHVITRTELLRHSARMPPPASDQAV